MLCQKCGKKLKKHEDFCTYCGYYNGEVYDNDLKFGGSTESEMSLDQLPEGNSIDENKNELDYSDERYLEAFVGEDYKIIKSPFNIFAVLLNWVYFLYRKLYISGLIGLVITFIVIKYYDNYFIWYILGTSLLFGLLFNPYYLLVSKLKIKRLEKKNKDCDIFTFTNICVENGGVNAFIAFIIFIIFIIIVFFSKVYFQFNSKHNTRFWDENSENLAMCSQLTKLSYKEVQKNFEYGKIQGGVCKLVKNPTKMYEVYIKMAKDTQSIYVFYLAKDGELVYQGDNFKQNELELKKANYTITSEETSVLTEYQKFGRIYYNISKKSKLEKELIEKKKNTEARLNYDFTSDELDKRKIFPFFVVLFLLFYI